MTWLLFMDESGHDHRKMPAEVRGGFAIHINKLWSFIQAWHHVELEAFGIRLIEYKKEIKGHKLLDRDRFKWATQADSLTDEDRHKGVRRFLTIPLQGGTPKRGDFTAYGQACLELARQTFVLLKRFDARIFASVVPRGVRRPENYRFDHYLRKDHVFLLERFFYFLELKREYGLLIMDETDKTEDRRFVGNLYSYFTKTQNGRYRTAWIVPSPVFVASEMAVGVQVADIAIYCINWGFRPPTWNFTGPDRAEIASEFGQAISGLQHTGSSQRGGQDYQHWSIVYVPDPYTARN